jgi:hypothetical protein
MSTLAHIGLGAIVGLIGGFTLGTQHGQNIHPCATAIMTITQFVFADNGDSVSVIGVMKVVDPIAIKYPGNAFSATCTRTECRTVVALANTSFLDMEWGFGLSRVKEFSRQKIVFEEDGGSLSMVLGKHRDFTFTLDRKAETVRAVGRPDDTTNDTGQNAIFELTGLGVKGSRLQRIP